MSLMEKLLQLLGLGDDELEEDEDEEYDLF